MKYFLILFMIMAPLAFADIYMQTDKNGNVTYTDTPEKNSQKIEVTVPSLHDRPTVETSTKTSTTETTTVPGTPEKKPYKVFGITSPLDQDTIQNDPNIMITVTVDPPLQTGDKVQAFLDGKPIGNPVAGTQITLGRLERGTHTVKAAIIDSNQTVLKVSQTITLYVHYAHVQ